MSHADRYRSEAGSATRLRPLRRAGHRSRAIAVTAGAVLVAQLLVGCTAHPTSQPGPGATGSLSGASAAGGGSGAPDGANAMQLAAALGKCVDARSVGRSELVAVAPVLTGHTTQLGAVSTAAVCAMETHPILLMTFDDPNTVVSVTRELQPVAAPFAAGDLWIALPAQPDSAEQALSLAQGAALSLAGRIIRAGAALTSGSAGATG